ncbi:MAG: hypothetical protein ACRC1K_00630, partial [Planctomycetia bacterium]
MDGRGVAGGSFVGAGGPAGKADGATAPALVGRWLAGERALLKQRYEAGEKGRPLAVAVSRLYEEAVVRLYDANLAKLNSNDRGAVESELALVCVGGFGRGELAPHSDVDLLFLQSPDSDPAVEKFARHMVRDVWDAGLALGHTIATAKGTLELARVETLPATSLLHHRFLSGCRTVYDRLAVQIAKLPKRIGPRRFHRCAVRAIREEQKKFGASAHLLEPDVKRSPGGLRELHLLGWLGIVQHRTADVHELVKKGVLTTSEADAVDAAHEFLLRVRFGLHFHAGQAQDSLTRAEQLRLAREWGYRDEPGLLAVEKFMRDYVRRTTALADVVARFVVAEQPVSTAKSLKTALLSRRVQPGVWITPDALVV